MARTLKISVKNAAYQQLEALGRNRDKRRAMKLFFVEGVHPIEQAILHGWDFEAIAYAGDKRLSGWANDMLSKAHANIHYELTTSLMDELSDREQACELVAILKMRTNEQALQAMAPRDAAPLYVAFDRPQSPGNLGSIIRSADAMRATGLITTGHGADLYDPQCVRASIGALFALPVAALPGIDELLAWRDTLPVTPRIIGTSAHGVRMVDECDMRGPTLLAVGNETFGLSKAWKEISDELLRIPIFGATSSLNAASAASICLYEIQRQRLGGAIKPSIAPVPSEKP